MPVNFDDAPAAVRSLAITAANVADVPLHFVTIGDTDHGDVRVPGAYSLAIEGSNVENWCGKVATIARKSHRYTDWFAEPVNHVILGMYPRTDERTGSR